MQKLLAILWWFVLPLAAWGGVASWACGQDSLEGGSWSGKITATADAPGSSLTDFFYVVQIDSSQTQFWAAVQNDGDDVRASVDGTQVPCWVDPATFNYAGQSCIVYVMRSGAASTAPVIRIYFGNSGASLPSTSATYGQFNTFPSSLKAFYPRGGGDDVTSNANNLTMTGSPTVGGVAGPISGSLATDYNGTTQYGEATASVPTATPLFIGVSMRPDVVSRIQDQASIYSSTAVTSNQHLWSANINASGVARASTADGTAFTSATAGTATASTWGSLGAGFASATSRVAYWNGTAGSAETTSRTPSGTDRIAVAWRGSPSSGGNVNFDGRIAFARFFTADVGATWESYWHSMLADPDQSDFYNGWTYASLSSTIVPLLQRMQLNMSLVRPTQWDRFVSLTPIILEK